MKRRQALLTLPATAAAAAASCVQSRGAEEAVFDYENPYESVDWDSWELVDSMSHQHQGTTQKSLELFHEMGYGHFAFSNYYPSAPTALLPAFRDHPAQIARLHDRQMKRGPTFYGNSSELRTPLPIVDQIFSQPIRRAKV